MQLNTAKCNIYDLILFRVLLDRLKSIVIAIQWLIKLFGSLVFEHAFGNLALNHYQLSLHSDDMHGSMLDI